MARVCDVFVEVVIWVWTVRVATAVLPSYSLHVTGCGGRPISPTHYAGELTLHTEYVHEVFNRTQRCDIMITPKTLNNNSRVMYYFTEFDIGGRCTDNNITIYDGQEYTAYRDLCGHNTSLTNQTNIFTSTDTGIRVVYRWNDRGSHLNGTVKMVFVSYYDGPCGSDNDFSCSTDRCISSDISCRDDLNYCGNGDEPECKMYATMQTILRSLVNVARNIFLLVAIVVVLSLLKRIIYTRLKERHGSMLNIPIVRRIFGHNHTNNTRNESIRLDGNTNIQSGNTRPELDSVPLTYSEPRVEPYNTTDSDPRGVPCNTMDSDVIMGLPSYEEVIRSNNTYPTVDPSHTDPKFDLPVGASSTTPPPTYDDVIANNGKALKL